ncbi:MAG: hypothetical protein IJR52_04380 [Selenomonadaceae bacterium]|nr:hypothetical protein [Selenomonadaceae bacterium]MBR0101954.1 hypothetical protein [Selenomonadaceae bacterium]
MSGADDTITAALLACADFKLPEWEREIGEELLADSTKLICATLDETKNLRDPNQSLEMRKLRAQWLENLRYFRHWARDWHDEQIKFGRRRPEIFGGDSLEG